MIRALRTFHRRSWLSLSLAAALAGTGTAAAQSDTARVGLATAFTAVDPHYHNQSTNFALGLHLFDPLVTREANGDLVPALATAWRTVDDRTWEFDLRRDVRFHNGDAFTAEDVVASLARVRTVRSPSSYAVYLQSIEAVEILDTHRIRIRTREPNPSLLIELSLILIVNKRKAPIAMSSERHFFHLTLCLTRASDSLRNSVSGARKPSSVARTSRSINLLKACRYAFIEA